MSGTRLLTCFSFLQLNEALGGGSGRGEPEIPEARATVDYTEARGPGDEAWADT